MDQGQMLRVGLFTVLASALVLLPLSGDGNGRLSAARRPAERAARPPSLEVPAAIRRTVAPGAANAGLLRPSLYPLHLKPLRGERVITPRTHGARELVLTFDDGPDLFGTPVVLQELERRGLKAIFFVNGQHMVGSRPEDFARRDLIRKIAAQGHLVANHTLSHRNVCADPDSLEQEIDGNAEIITAATGLRPLLFRAPYGARCRRLDQALRTRELLQVGWNLDPQDWKGGKDGMGGSDEVVFQYVTGRLERFGGRAILLLHDTKREAVRALPRILDWIDRENDRLVRAGEPPIKLRDYSVFLPPVPLPETGLEPLIQPMMTEILGQLAELHQTLSVFAAR
jgi:peptidoglycan/xylan/chitin deacetylase (PgdA/CDA1 family)